MEDFSLIERDVLARLSADGQLDGLLTARAIRDFLPALGRVLDVDASEAIEALDGHDRLVADMTDALELASLGWAITPAIHYESPTAALSV
jgi:hypothetical protein